MLQFLLKPFSFLYRVATDIRNHLYDSGHRTSFEFDRFILCVGNLSVGGTGKTPMVEYLLRRLQPAFKVATLSRGYGRKSRGFRLAQPGDSANTLGDEPYQFHLKFPDVPVAVGEERAVAIPHILAEFPDTEIILLDDAFQHRAVKPDFSIVLTTFEKPFFSDHLLPEGRLRESRQGAARADLIVVTKCPDELDEKIRVEYQKRIQHYAGEIPVFFSRVDYGEWTGQTPEAQPTGKAIIFTGIANPRPFVQFVNGKFPVSAVKEYPDHHNFSERDITELVALAEAGNSFFITTEKDFVRMPLEMKARLEKAGPLGYVPISIRIDKSEEFDGMILDAIRDSLKDNA